MCILIVSIMVKVDVYLSNRLNATQKFSKETIPILFVFHTIPSIGHESSR